MLSHSLIPLFLLALRLQLANAITEWSIVEYDIEIITASVDDIDTDFTFTDTTTIHLYPPVPTSIAPTAVRAVSTTKSFDTYFNAVTETRYIAATALPATQLASIKAYATSTSINSDSTYSSFIIDKVYTAPASCPTSFDFTTTSVLYVPLGAATNLPIATNTSTSQGLYYNYVTVFLSADVEVPQSSTSSVDFVQRYYINSCSNPGASSTYTSGPISGGGGRYSGGGDYYYDDSDVNCLGSLCPFWLIYIVVIIPVLGLLFIGGFFESYFWFSRLMKGQFALRGVPLLWVSISLWTLLCLRRKRPANQQYRPQLEKQWREMSTAKHISLWFKYGFRHRDPPELTNAIGSQPPVAPVWGPYPQQQPQVYYGPPGAGPGAGASPQIQQAPNFYQQPQPWQGGSPAQGWTAYPPPGTQSPQPGYMYTAPAPQQGQWQPQGQDRSVATTESPHHLAAGASSPSGVADSGTAVSPMSAEGAQHTQQAQQGPGTSSGSSTGGDATHGAPAVVSELPKQHD